MKVFVAIVFIGITTILHQTSGQFFGDFQSFGGVFSSGLDQSQFQISSRIVPQRDPRQNTGPILFPPAPADTGETSGVIVGASGYGFVPPNQQNVQPVGVQNFF